jgi:hypothetical protein
VAGRDMEGVRIYVVPQSLLPDDLGGRSVCGGYTASRLDLHLRDHIPGYKGRGACMVINDDLIRETRAREDFDYYFCATLLHELTHVLMRPWLYREPATAPDDAIRREARQVAHMVATETPEDGRPAFHGHGAQFIRIALHLCHRAETWGAWFAPNDLCAGRRYRLSHARRYQVALGNEPRRMATSLVKEILAADPPADFARLWADDVHTYFRSVSHRKEPAYDSVHSA